MSTAAAWRTLADVLKAVDDVPPERVLWAPLPGTATERDMLRDKVAELVDGVLVRKALALWKSHLEMVIGCHLMNYVRPDRLGAITIGTGPHRLAPGVVRRPDLAFIRWDRLRDESGRIPDIAAVGPDLVAEVPTAENTHDQLARKRREFFAAGAKVLWETKTIDVYTDPDTRTVLTTADTLTGDPVLPGFALPLRDLFNDPQLNPRPTRNP